ncbi:MAG: hypothetical protein JO037_15320 [Actinobacteria bacterium]|nr:hypothetical protein [Actinomycetota bacterium]
MNTTHGTPAGASPADPSLARARRKRFFRWGAGITVAGFLAGGGITLAATTGGLAAAPAAAGSSANGAVSNGAVSNGPLSDGSLSDGPLSDGQGAVLNSALSAAAGSGPTATPARVRGALRRLRLLGSIHGDVTFSDKTGFHTLSFERGTIESVTGSTVVIKAADGTTWTWQIVSDTVVRKNAAKTTTSALSAGETVFAGGPLAGAARDARLIVIRTAASSGSGSARSSLS